MNVTPRLSLDTLLDYSDEYQRMERKSVGARYNPSGYRVINTAYRYQRESSEVMDVSWQWPLNDLWRDLGLDRQQGQGLGEGRLYSIGRFNYSLLEKRLVESMLGVEYDGGCWVSRFALQRTQLTLTTSTTSLMQICARSISSWRWLTTNPSPTKRSTTWPPWSILRPTNWAAKIYCEKRWKTSSTNQRNCKWPDKAICKSLLKSCNKRLKVPPNATKSQCKKCSSA